MSSRSRQNAIIALLMFVFLAVLYRISPHRQFADSYYSMLVSESLLTHQSANLARYFQRPLDPDHYPGLMPEGLPYHVTEYGDQIHYFFPLGSSLLSLPVVALSRVFWRPIASSDGHYDATAERELQRLIAPHLAAGFCVLVFLCARMLVGLLPSVLIALSFGLATSIWSTLSRGLWSHDWTVFLLGIAAMNLLGDALGRWKLNPSLLASLLAWSYFTRPTAAIPLACIGLYLWVERRDAVPRFGVVLGCWLSVFIGFSLWQYGSMLPPYYLATRLGGQNYATAVLGNLVSPGRGLFVYSPQLLLIGYAAWRYRAEWKARRLVLLCIAITFLHWQAISMFDHWWGGHSYGPRLMSDALPWLALLCIVAVHAWLEAHKQGSTRGRAIRLGEQVALTLLLAIGIGINAAGSFSDGADTWNASPTSIDTTPERLWDWTDPPFLRRASEEAGVSGP